MSRRSGRLSGDAPCGGCHAYPPPDLNHDYHLFSTFSATVYSDPVTCYDCHALSIQADTQYVLDTIFRGFFGEEISSLDHPDDERIRDSLEIIRVDSLTEVIPEAYGGQDSIETNLLKWMTSIAHFNGKVEVKMPNRITGSFAEYNSQELTCSAVDCHTGEEDYSFFVGWSE